MEKSFQNERKFIFMFIKKLPRKNNNPSWQFFIKLLILNRNSLHHISTSGSFTPENICSTPLA